MKDSCSSISDLLEKYFDQEVTDEEGSLVDGHLHDCPSCQDALKTMEGLRYLIKAPIDEADQKENYYWVWQKIEKEIQREEKPAVRESIRRWLDITPLFRKKVWVPAAAAIVAVFLALAPSVFKKTPSSSEASVVEYLESQSYNVMVYESEKGNVTVIWLLEEPEKEGSSES
ncbi:MAG: hypothetical protein A2157_10435 [Deltaproteobacteria bacterium RBG_16_47_11]|nr:MAG: hypothetical protein A2157_10435 [Deltaproteobacteria bacterium RBG_16_47_11]